GAGGLGDGGVADQDPEAVGVRLDVLEQRERGALDDPLGVPAGPQCPAQRLEEVLQLAVDDDCVHALLAAEVLVDDRLGDLRPRRHLLDARPLEPLLGEQGTADVEQLLTPLPGGHPGPRGAISVTRHPPIMPWTSARAAPRAWQTGRCVAAATWSALV